MSVWSWLPFVIVSAGIVLAIDSLSDFLAMLSRCALWSGVRKPGTHRSKTYVIPSSLCSIFLTLPKDILMDIWFIVNRMSFLTMWWTRSVLFLGGRGTSWTWVVFKSLPSLLNSTAHFYTVYKAGASSPNVITMSTWMYFECKPLFRRYSIKVRY